MKEKNNFRKSSIKRLKKISNTKMKYKIDKDIIKKLKDEIKRNNAKNIMLYIPLDIEVNIMLLIKELRAKKKIIFVPFMESKSFRLVKYRLPLKNKQFGVREPKSSRVYKKIKIDLSIVPIVATDSTLRRVGFGKGMYDRFFAIYKKDIKRTIFVMRSLCFSKNIITNSYDIKCDILITKEGIKKRRYNRVL